MITVWWKRPGLSRIIYHLHNCNLKYTAIKLRKIYYLYIEISANQGFLCYEYFKEFQLNWFFLMGTWCTAGLDTTVGVCSQNDWGVPSGDCGSLIETLLGCRCPHLWQHDKLLKICSSSIAKKGKFTLTSNNSSISHVSPLGEQGTSEFYGAWVRNSFSPFPLRPINHCANGVDANINLSSLDVVLLTMSKCIQISPGRQPLRLQGSPTRALFQYLRWHRSSTNVTSSSIIL